MHIFNDAQKRIQEFVSANATTLLTAGGVVGTVGTAVLSGRAGFKAHQIIRQHELDASIEAENLHKERTGEDVDIFIQMGKLERTKIVAVYFIPPVLTCTATVASIILSHRMSAQKAAALAAAYGLAQGQFEEYRDKVTEKLTGAKKQQINEELAQDQVNKTPGGSQIVLVSGEDTLFFDRPTGRYFKSSVEKVNRAIMATQQEVINHGFAEASFFYQELEMPETAWANVVGWNLDNQIEVDFEAVVAEDGRPCLALNFTKFPIEDYVRHRDAYL